MPSTPRRTSTASIRPLRLPDGKSICVRSPVTTILELNPCRVSTIFICSAVLFCASSRIMKLSFKVRPRMNAMGATSITERSSSFSTLSASSMSYKASYSGRR